MSRHFDAVVVGAGQAGSPLAARLAGAGMTVALVERHLVGGTCVNTGCMPTKTLVASAYAAHMARRAGEYGVLFDGPVAIDMHKVRSRAAQITLNARGGLENWLGGIDKVTLLRGHARFTGAKTLTVGDEEISGERIFLNVGGRAVRPPMPGIGDVPVMTNTDIVVLDTLPRHLVVVGGSYIGLEFAQMYRRFGSDVTVVEKGPRLIGREDPEVSQAVQDMLAKEGIAFRLSAECIQFAPHADGVTVGVDCESGDRQVVGSHVLLAIGRQPNTGDLGLDAAGVAMDARGYVQVNDTLETSAPGIWALGDCNGRGAFTHTSYNDYEIVADNLLDGANRKVSDRITTYALFVDPPLARCGMSPLEAQAAGHKVLVGRRAMTRVGRANERAENQGFMQITVDADSQAILGATIFGVSGDEAIHCILDLMYLKAPVTALTHAVHIHPTVAELLPTIGGELKPSRRGLRDFLASERQRLQ